MIRAVTRLDEYIRNEFCQIDWLCEVENLESEWKTCKQPMHGICLETPSDDSVIAAIDHRRKDRA